jgi:hypothetical protein
MGKMKRVQQENSVYVVKCAATDLGRSTKRRMKLKAETWEQKCDAVSTLKVFAGLALFGGLCSIGVCLMTKGGGHDISRAWPWVGLLPALIGAAALLGSKITAILFSMMSVCVAILLIMPCFTARPHPAMIIPILIALLCCLPVLFTFRG